MSIFLQSRGPAVLTYQTFVGETERPTGSMSPMAPRFRRNLSASVHNRDFHISANESNDRSITPEAKTTRVPALAY